MTPLDAILPSDEWSAIGVHWHAFVERRERNMPMRTGYRTDRLRRKPDSVLWSPWTVADWIDARTREHVHHREVWSSQEGEWVAIGDEDDLNELRRNNFMVASRGDSIYADVYTLNVHHDLFVEAVTGEQCGRGCVDTGEGDSDSAA